MKFHWPTKKELAWIVLVNLAFVGGFVYGHALGTTVVVRNYGDNPNNGNIVKNCTPIYYYTPGSPFAPLIPPAYRNMTYIIYSCQVGK